MHRQAIRREAFRLIDENRERPPPPPGLLADVAEVSPSTFFRPR